MSIEIEVHNIKGRLDRTEEITAALQHQVQRAIDVSTETNAAVTKLTERMTALIEAVEPAVEAWKKNHYAMLRFKELVGNARYYVAIGVGVLAFFKIDILLRLFTGGL